MKKRKIVISELSNRQLSRLIFTTSRNIVKMKRFLELLQIEAKIRDKKYTLYKEKQVDSENEDTSIKTTV